MKFGLVLPALPGRELAELGAAAESAGWDGFFIWDIFLGLNPWLCLAAVALRTERIRLGTMLTPPSRRRPWQLASEAVTLDQLSNGRLILAFGLGAAEDAGFARVGEVTDRRVRAQLLDETLDILEGLWQGGPFSYQGQHYQIDNATFGPPPLQTPRIPIWLVGAWPRPKSLRRALRYDGVIAEKKDAANTPMTPADVQALRNLISEQHRAATPFDIVLGLDLPAGDPAAAGAAAKRWADAGLTWYLGELWPFYEQGGIDGLLARIHQGPPRLSEQCTPLDLATGV